MPVYVRAGAIIPVDPVRQYSGEVAKVPTTLKIYTGASGSYTLYEDDGISQDYLKGKGTWTQMIWYNKIKKLTIEPGAPKGLTNVTTPRIFKIEIIPGGETRKVRYLGKHMEVIF